MTRRVEMLKHGKTGEASERVIYIKKRTECVKRLKLKQN